jgi:hypothetical protein
VSHGQTLLIPTTRNDADSELTDTPPPLADADIDTPSSGVLLGSTEPEILDLLQSLPRNLHADKKVPQGDAVSETSRPLEILEEEQEEESEEGLQIAWQYRKSVQQERLGHGASAAKQSPAGVGTTPDDTYCHSFDLSGRMSEQRNVEDHVTIFNGSCCCAKQPCSQSRSCGFRLYQCWLTQLKQTLAESNKQVIRLLLYRAPIQSTSVALPLLLAYIRTHQLPVVIMITSQSWTSQEGLIALRRSSDVVLQTEGFASRVHYPPPPEFRHLHGLLLIPKVSIVTAATANGGGGHFADLTVSKRPPAHVYGLKRDRRKLHIPLLHIPPEDYAGGGGSVGSGAVRSGAGRPKKETNETGGCGSSGGGTSLLDF